MCRANFQGSGYKQGMTKVSLQLPGKGSGTIVPVTRNFMPLEEQSVSDGGGTLDRQSFRKRMSRAQLFFCRGYGGHLRSKPLLTRKH